MQAARITDDRARLVATARAELRDGRLALGEFLLRANALDADERGAPGFHGHEFRSAYRVFRGLAARFWEGQRPVDQTLAALAGEARAAGLDPEWEALFLEYYGRNLIGVYQTRAGAPEMMRLLTRAVEENRHPALDALRRMIDAEASERMGTRPVL